MPVCASLEEVRGAIDALDLQLVHLLAARRDLVLQAARFKKTDQDVRAPARVEQVIARVRGLAAAEGIEPDLVEALYRQLIAGFIQVERAAHAAGARTPGP